MDNPIWWFVYGAPGEIRTPDPLVRSQVLYPTELRAHFLVIIANLKYMSRNFYAFNDIF